MIETLKVLFAILGLLAIFYIGAAIFIWPFRNPLANRTTIITHPIAVMSFQALPQFQEKP